MVAPSVLPNVTSQIAAPNGTCTTEWRNFFLSLANQADNESLRVLYEDLAARVQALEDAGISDLQILGVDSVVVDGLASNGLVQIRLRGDVQIPENSQYYGTNTVGERGWYVLDLEALTDIDLTVPPVSGDGLVFNGTKWIAGQVASPQVFNRITEDGDIRSTADGALRITN